MFTKMLKKSRWNYGETSVKHHRGTRFLALIFGADFRAVFVRFGRIVRFVLFSPDYCIFFTQFVTLRHCKTNIASAGRSLGFKASQLPSLNSFSFAQGEWNAKRKGKASRDTKVDLSWYGMRTTEARHLKDSVLRVRTKPRAQTKGWCECGGTIHIQPRESNCPVTLPIYHTALRRCRFFGSLPRMWKSYKADYTLNPPTLSVVVY